LRADGEKAGSVAKVYEERKDDGRDVSFLVVLTLGMRVRTFFAGVFPAKQEKKSAI